MAGDVRLHTRFQQGHPRAPGNRRLAAIRRPREHQVTLLPPQQRGRRFPARLTCASSAGRAAACCRFHRPVAQRVSARSSAHAASGTATLGSAQGTVCTHQSPAGKPPGSAGIIDRSVPRPRTGPVTPTVPPRRADELLSSLAERVGGRVATSTVFAPPVERGGITVIPVATSGRHDGSVGPLSRSAAPRLDGSCVHRVCRIVNGAARLPMLGSDVQCVWSADPSSAAIQAVVQRQASLRPRRSLRLPGAAEGCRPVGRSDRRWSIDGRRVARAAIGRSARWCCRSGRSSRRSPSSGRPACSWCAGSSACTSARRDRRLSARSPMVCLLGAASTSCTAR
jgi:hypothetical protein